MPAETRWTFTMISASPLPGSAMSSAPGLPTLHQLSRRLDNWISAAIANPRVAWMTGRRLGREAGSGSSRRSSSRTQDGHKSQQHAA
jgi:hypothetical protein